MIHLNNISLQFGNKIIFENANWHIKSGSRYALIGRNGVGKTTLFRILTKEQHIDKGEILERGNLKIAYLPQEHKMVSNKTILDELLLDNEEIVGLHKELIELEHELAKGNDAILDKYTDLSLKFEHLGGFEYETKAKMILSGIGFKREDFDKPISEFSGGWRMRVYLSKLLLRNPDLLLLDEPTNHLDLPALIWLESYLSSFPGTLIIISHDRDFLNKVTNHITELSINKISTYTGNYDFYLNKKVENEELIYKRYEKQQEEMEHLKKFINKFKAKATKAAQARSRMKQLEKIEENLIVLPQKAADIKFQIPFSTQSGKEVLSINNLTQKYDEKEIFINTELTVYREERAAVVGANGIGKTTLLKVIANLIKYSGEVKLGYNVKFSYFGQHQIDELNTNNDIITEVETFADFEDIPKLRKLLGNFMFTGETVFQKISTLSGGEKSRVALVKILLEKSNLLLLDEPTNHLDMETKELLLKALKEYSGTIVIVSHDKYFIENLATSILLIKDNKIIKYDGGLDYYLEKFNQEKSENNEKNEDVINTSNKKDKKRYEAELRQRKFKVLKPINDELEKVEEEIETLENDKNLAVEEMSEPSFYNKDSLYISNFHKRLSEIEGKLDSLQNSWEELSMKIEEIEKNFI
jgi:ATP-binding cassette subfamily F protein 3